MISTHVLDTSLGAPAAGISVKLQKKEDAGWKDLGAGRTDADGRFTFDCERTTGTFQIVFETGEYLQKSAKDFFFPIAQVVFKVENPQRKYHIPLLLSPFAYSTYRGS